MKIGITERGDAGRDLRWTCSINHPEIDGAILITKSITPEFIRAVMDCKKPTIVHCTCTGYGGTVLEPGAPFPSVQLDSLKCLVQAGFPANNIVLRVDPIFPSDKGLAKAKTVLDAYAAMQINNRVRISIVDEYPHVRQRYAERGWKPLYGGGFYPNEEQIIKTAQLLSQYPMFNFETCAEHKLAQVGQSIGVNIGEVGCVSNIDLSLMGLSTINTTVNPQKRSGCLCLSIKTELLTDRKPCANSCVYCFWK